MPTFDVMLAFAALLALCLFFNRRCGVAGGHTPLLAAAVFSLALMAFGIAGLLRAGGWTLYIASFALGVYALLPRREPAGRTVKPAPELFDFGFCAFWAFSLGAAAVLAVRQPIFYEWDELSFWGTACKLLKLNDRLYTTASVGWDWVGAQQPGALLLSYFFQFFGSFAPWKCFVGYDVLLFAASAAVLGGVPLRRYALGVPAMLLCVLAPFLATLHARIIEPTNLYMSVYGDIPAGMAAGGAAAWYFSARRAAAAEPNGRVLPRGMWGIFIVLAAAGVIKENAFPIALVAAGLAAADALFCLRGRRLWRRFAFAAGALASPAASYLVWNLHVRSIVSLRESAGEVGSTNYGLAEVLRMGFYQLLHPAGRTAVFSQVLHDFPEAFYTRRLTMAGYFSGTVLEKHLGAQNPLTRLAGTGLAFTVLIVLLFCAAAFSCRSAVGRRRTLWAAGLSVLGYAGYSWVLILSYAFIFKPVLADDLAEYGRYLSTYYVFWLLLAAVLLVNAACERPARPLAGLCLLLCAAVGLAGVQQAARPQQTLLACPQSTFADQRAIAQKAQQVRSLVAADGGNGSIFFVSTADNGGRYFSFCYELLPLQMDYSFGGGPLGSADDNDGSLYYHAYSCAELADYLQRKGCEYIFLDEYNENFRSEYAALFSDGLAAADAGTAFVYRRAAGGTVLFSPCTEVTP